MTIRVILDPGHGGLNPDGRYVTPGKRYIYDADPPGAVYEGHRMRVLSVYLALELLARGVEVFSALTGRQASPLWRPVWADVGLSERVRQVNARADVPALLVSLHSNAISRSSSGPGQARARGISVYTSRGETSADRWASSIWHSVKGANLLPMRQDAGDGDPDYEAGFTMLRRTTCPAVLIELGFHDHPADALMLMDDGFMRDAAIAIADGIEAEERGDDTLDEEG